MNKKGFTLLELIMSIVLVSIVLTSMLATLVKLKENYTKVYENSDALIYGSSISRIINNDINNNGGIKHLDCPDTTTYCDIILSNDKKRKLKVYDVEIGKLYTNTKINGVDTTINFYCETDPKCEKTGDTINCTCPVKKLSNTLEYIDTTDGSEKVIYMKTLSLIKNTDSDTGRVTSNGYNFGSIDSNSYEFDSLTKIVKNESQAYKNLFTTITVGLFDGIDEEDRRYNIILSSSASYSPKAVRTGDEIRIDIDYDVDSINAVTINNEIRVFYESYNVGYYHKTYENSVEKKNNITSLSVPVPEAGNNHVFDGYYFITPTGSRIEITDNTGKILVENSFFTSDSTIIAAWKVK